ncbi:MAG: esterase/lipase family protein [Mycobacteriales bacterium]|nr:alpha/beta fold hydrolase [Frankia sp.]
MRIRVPFVVAAALMLAAPAVAVRAAGATVSTSFPADFAVPIDAALRKPVIGFGGSAGRVRHVPVIFLHGNNDTPYNTGCAGAFGHIHDFAQYFSDHGYAPRELWALGYQGDQCDLATTPTNKSGPAHSTAANVADLRAFVRAVLRYTGAKQVDLVGHSLGGTLVREWLRQDRAYKLVRRVVAVDAPSHGIINCSPSPQNIWALPALGGFTPDSAICREYGSDRTPFLTRLNHAGESPGPTKWLAIYNADVSFVYIDKQDGPLPPVPAQDRDGKPHDFSRSAIHRGATNIPVVNQGSHDPDLMTAHLGIVNSPEVWQLALDFLSRR